MTYETFIYFSLFKFMISMTSYTGFNMYKNVSDNIAHTAIYFNTYFRSGCTELLFIYLANIL